jgi:iron complex transport system substrate-binding protein
MGKSQSDGKQEPPMSIRIVRPSQILSALVVAACTLWPALAAAETVIKHAQGETTLPDRPAKVLTFDLASLDTLDALGVDVAGVPGSNMPEFLAKFRDDRYLKIGSLFEPDFEKVHAAKPDLIIVAGRSSSKYADLAKIAPTIDLTIAPTNFVGGTKQNIETLGRIFGKETEAAALVSDIDSSIAKAREEAANAGGTLMLMVNGGKLTAYGKGSRFGWIHDAFGLKPAVENIKAANHGEAVSFEFLLKANPDFLLVLDRDAAIGQSGTAARQVLDNELVAATNAAKTGRILYVEPARWYIVGGGARSLKATADEISSALSAAQ